MAWNCIFLLFNANHTLAALIILVSVLMFMFPVFLLLQSIFFNQFDSFLAELVPSYNSGDIRIRKNAKRIWGGVVDVPKGHLAGYQAEELSEGALLDRKALVWSPVKVEDCEDSLQRICGTYLSVSQ